MVYDSEKIALLKQIKELKEKVSSLECATTVINLKNEVARLENLVNESKTQNESLIRVILAPHELGRTIEAMKEGGGDVSVYAVRINNPEKIDAENKDVLSYVSYIISSLYKNLRATRKQPELSSSKGEVHSLNYSAPKKDVLLPAFKDKGVFYVIVPVGYRGALAALRRWALKYKDEIARAYDGKPPVGITMGVTSCEAVKDVDNLDSLLLKQLDDSKVHLQYKEGDVWKTVLASSKEPEVIDIEPEIRNIVDPVYAQKYLLEKGGKEEENFRTGAQSMAKLLKGYTEKDAEKVRILDSLYKDYGSDDLCGKKFVDIHTQGLIALAHEAKGIREMGNYSTAIWRVKELKTADIYTAIGNILNGIVEKDKNVISNATPESLRNQLGAFEAIELAANVQMDYSRKGTPTIRKEYKYALIGKYPFENTLVGLHSAEKGELKDTIKSLKEQLGYIKGELNQSNV